MADVKTPQIASNDTDLVIDIDGYFAPAGPGGLSLYPASPCRVIDTRQLGPPFTGTLTPPVDVVDSICGTPSTAQAYVFNVTVVPSGGLGYLTLWPDGEQKPVVSSLHAVDGKVDAYASGLTPTDPRHLQLLRVVGPKPTQMRQRERVCRISVHHSSAPVSNHLPSREQYRLITFSAWRRSLLDGSVRKEG